MSGEKNLGKLLASMTPELVDETYVFATVATNFDYSALRPRMAFTENEGITLILEKATAIKQDLKWEFSCRMITLNIHSALDAVGFLAAITAKLAALDMGVNPVSAFYHDHLFIPEDRVDDAMAALRELSSSSK